MHMSDRINDYKMRSDLNRCFNDDNLTNKSRSNDCVNVLQNKSINNSA